MFLFQNYIKTTNYENSFYFKGVCLTQEGQRLYFKFFYLVLLTSSPQHGFFLYQQVISSFILAGLIQFLHQQVISSFYTGRSRLVFYDSMSYLVLYQQVLSSFYTSRSYLVFILAGHIQFFIISCHIQFYTSRSYLVLTLAGHIQFLYQQVISSFL